MPGEVKPNHIGESNEMVLKPCPFCGGGTEIRSIDEGNGSFTAISCRSNQHSVFIHADDETAAIAAWNRRAPEPGTSIVKWVRYDGTPETGPKTVSLIYRENAWRIGFTHMQIGDIWAYLYEPPEGMG